MNRLSSLPRRLAKAGLRKIAIRENVYFSKDIHVGPGSVVWAPNRLTIGKHVYIGKYVTIEVDGEIGDETLFANGSGVIGKSDHDISAVGRPIRSAPWVGDHPRLSQPVSIGSDCWIGFNACIQSGVRIGNSTIIGSGAVVTTDIPPNSIAVGVPARVVRQRFDQSEFVEHWRNLSEQGITWIEYS